ncbi:alpha/beta hydrolase fold protein [Roseibium sp. TrichSKD4]|nr:alpha/beta hydrolase fold protein [Roseibium sp. TrichSKD4]
MSLVLIHGSLHDELFMLIDHSDGGRIIKAIEDEAGGSFRMGESSQAQ